VLPFELFVDQALMDNERIAFNAGTLTDSIVLRLADYLAVAQPLIRTFSLPADPPPTDDAPRAAQ
jgi:prolyl-tRNA editing enzyme YbaK/EbsC (Cys-tRNA(Pro) deacylase)